MSKHIIEFDSSERDPVDFPSPNDYTVHLSKPIYDVSDIKLISARIPKSQPTINYGNKQFDVDGTTVVLNENVYSNAHVFASDLDTQLGVNYTVTYDDNTQKLTFEHASTDFTFEFYGGSNGYATSSTVGTPATVMGFEGANVSSSSQILVSNVVDLSGPGSIILRLSSGDDVLKQEVYTNIEYYTGRILTGNPSEEIIEFTYFDDIVDERFHTGHLKVIDSIRVQMFWNNGKKLIPYDFKGRNHVLKFEVTCNTDKLNTTLTDAKLPDESFPEPVEIPNLEFRKRNTYMYVLIFVGLLIGLYILSGKR